jgi:hypothetical protein
MRLASLALLVLANTLAGCAMPGKQLSTYSEFIGGPCDSADITLYSEEYGEGDPILLIHGLGMSSFTWRHLSEPLARDHRVISVDRRDSATRRSLAMTNSRFTIRLG